MKIQDRIAADVLTRIAAEIQDADGQEVLFVGKLSDENLVCEVYAAARGNESAAPAVASQMEKGDVVIHNHPSGSLSPSMADIQVASRIGSLGIGFYIIDNRATRIHVVAEPARGGALKKLDPDKLAGILEPGGRLSAQFESYEPRQVQIEMLKTVAGAFNDNTIAVVEAGTGVGKSFAYLIPALSWVMKNDERVVISTATINLQHQLYEKDIPFVRRLLGCREKIVLVKGRGNYLCLNRLEEAIEEISLFEDERDELLAIRAWAETTPTGVKSDLSFNLSDSLWSSVNSEADACLGLRCPFRERCFVLKVRREAAAARILVANHHLLFSDLAMRSEGAGYDSTAVLPPFQRIVFDEAHNLERSATSYFSELYTRFALYKFLGRLYRRRRGRNMGLVIGLQTMLDGREAIGKVPELIDAVKAQADLADSLSTSLLSGSGTYRLTAAPPDDPAAEDPTVRELLSALEELAVRILSLVRLLEDEISSLPEERQEDMPAYETRLVLRRLQGLAALCSKFSHFSEKPENVFWMERRRTSLGEHFTEYVSTPIDLSPLMTDAVFEPYGTVVCTSATLTVNGGFSFWKSRVGLRGFDRKEVRDAVFPSPFQYKERVLLGVPSDAPPPDDPAYESFLSQFTGDVLELSEGSGLVLFTSYEMMRRVFDAVATRLASRGITALRQGDDDRARLLARFKEDISSVLFATDSFWEGVDTPGDALRVVVLCRLPFKVPSDPVVKARMEAIERRGGNPFFELSLPEAVMKLKQGFGRLIRRNSDRGVVLIPDIRIVKKAYGTLFIRSLPETRRTIRDSRSLLSELESFLYP
jgi:ATP-dependent DNA helicase DinG